MNKFGVAIALVAALVGLASVASAHFEQSKRPTQNPTAQRPVQSEEFELEQKLHEADASQNVKQRKETSEVQEQQGEPEFVKGRKVPTRGRRPQQQQSPKTQRPTQSEEFELEQKLHEADASQNVKHRKETSESQEQRDEQEPAKGRKVSVRGRRQHQPQNPTAQRPVQSEEFELEQRLHEADASQNVKQRKEEFEAQEQQDDQEQFGRRPEQVKGRKGSFRGRRQQQQQQQQQPQNQGFQRPTQSEEFEVDQKAQEVDASQNVKQRKEEFEAQEQPEEPEHFSRRPEHVKGHKVPFRGHRHHQPQRPGHQARKPEHRGFPVRGPSHGRKPRVNQPGVCGGSKSGRGESEGENEDFPQGNEECEGCEQGPEKENEAEAGPN